MKKHFIRAFCIAAIASVTIPAFAQKEKDKSEKDEKKEVENIIITRRGNTNEKTIIEIDGDKVKINGKDANSLKDGDVTVRRNKIRDIQAYGRIRTPQGGSTFNFNFDNEGMALLAEDENRAMLGVVTDNDEKGAKINSVSKESAAEKAGLKAGDVITRIDDKKIGNAEEVSKIIRSHKPGDKVTITLLRDGKEQKITAELGKWKGVRMNAAPNVIAPEMFRTNPAMPGVPNEFRGYFSNAPRLGISVQDTDDGKGVKVLEVDDESNAGKAGIKEDDIITHVNDKEVNSTDEITKAVREARDKSSMMLRVLRNGKTKNIEVRTPRRLKTTDL
ncbi:MAG: PDZ domain-containing protein [Bacteroidota bacterium]|nr:PDZ domain-containing protein [Flavisolibacter sp.]MBD0351627.1 PDZ domain-containing protein [Flavisolibacter sp.]MBD0368452.1 PDZ domain-containing protein [Flavisolibacter sp.]MDQ3843855.1 PDZ domain-containing protein [Bacteroidota bacterium]